MASETNQPGAGLPQIELPAGLRRRLEVFRQQTWHLKLFEILLAGCLGLLVSYLVVFGIDRFTETSAEVRSLIFLGGFAIFGMGLPLTWERWSWRMRGLEAAARLIRRKMPRFGDQLLGTVQLAGHGSGSPALIRAAMEQADRKAAETDLREALPATRRMLWAGLLVGGALLLVTLFLISREASRNALARWATPWAPVDRYTFADVASVPDRIIVPYGEPFQFEVGLAETSRWRPLWGKAAVEGREGRDASVIRAQRSAEGVYLFSLPGRKEEGIFRVSVGDDRVRSTVIPAARPELAGMKAFVQLPDYLRYSHPLEIEAQDGTVAAVEGSVVRVEMRTSRPIVSAELDGAPIGWEGATLRAGPWNLSGTEEHRVTWRDELGLSPREALRFQLLSREDAAPKIVAKLEGPERTILSTEVVALEVEASDDYGVREIGLRWEGDKVGSKVAAAGGPEETSVGVRATFCPERERVEPQTIRLMAYVTDYRPGRSLVYSKPFTLRILSADEHLRWLTDEMAAWLRRAEEVHDREKQLHVENRSLRALSPGELDQEANRERLREQAQAETANARRVEQLAASGRKLAEEASRNDGFEAKRLDSFAKALEKLSEIAKERMPSVSDLLKEASEVEPGQEQHKASGSPPPTESKGAQPKSGGEQKPSEAASPEQKTPPAGADGKSSEAPPTPPDQDLKSLTQQKQAEASPSQPSAQPGAPSGLPTTTLQGAPESKSPESPAQEKTGKAVVEQTGLLAELAAINDEMRELLGDLQTSTFVRRLKAASREQLGIAGDLTKTLAVEFGVGFSQLSQDAVAIAKAAAEREVRQSEIMHQIRGDLEAFYQRRQMPPFKRLLEQMQESEVASKIREIAESLEANQNGRSVTEAEFWADTLDRWAEELVEAAQSGGGQQGQSGEAAGLPPKLVLEVMKILRDEIDLRDETREAEKAKPALTGEDFADRAKGLEEKQKGLRDRAYSVVKTIEDMPGGAETYQREVELLSAVSKILGEARNILGRPDTGPEAIAAETEAIELLLQARRSPPQGGGGSQNSSQSAGAAQQGINGLGPGADEPSAPRGRSVDQSTGKGGRELPEEFRRGLDQYFNTLEKESK
ncbi:MAG: hypothetical protein DVB23_000816 [Verrucomicrobia bacterium]|nr:MAG: hypothetical protein DVB23_000816 [Verrucomicrobiota bacterium]